MGETAISWTATRLIDGTTLQGYSFNPWLGCARVSPACGHCYAEEFARKRMGLDIWDDKQKKDRKVTTSTWKNPLTWNRKAVQEGIRRKVFCASMADVFEDHPTPNENRQRLWDLIAKTPMLDWLLLTKRPENVNRMVPTRWLEKNYVATEWPTYWPQNVWIGTSVENQHWADIRIPIMLTIPAQIRFLSCEPLLGPIDLAKSLDIVDAGLGNGQLDWIIVGGESGTKHRPMNLQWARDLRDQCKEGGIPFYFKQVGGLRSSSGGHLLDGEVYQEWPKYA